MTNTMITTIDNPFNPLMQFQEWYAWDISKGYHTCSYMARIANPSDELSAEEQDKAMDDAIDEIVLNNINGMYAKVVMTDEEMANFKP